MRANAIGLDDDDEDDDEKRGIGLLPNGVPCLAIWAGLTRGRGLATLAGRVGGPWVLMDAIVGGKVR